MQSAPERSQAGISAGLLVGWMHDVNLLGLLLTLRTLRSSLKPAHPGSDLRSPMTALIDTAARLIALADIRMEKGRCATVILPSWTGRGDHMAEPQASVLRLFEDGREIGPAHSLHSDIRSSGGGRYSHWEGMLFFSSSDGTPPASNGRFYQVLTTPPGPAAALQSMILSTSTMAELADVQRHTILSSATSLIAPGFILPDHGRQLEQDAEFHAAFRRFFPDHSNTMDRKYAVWQMAQLVDSLHGDMAEVGCYTGATSWFMADRIVRSGMPRSLHLFDSFAGLSHPGEKDGDYWREGALSAGEDLVRRNLAEFPFVHLHAGWVPDRFPDVDDHRFVLVHIDVDLYQPTKDSTAFFYERLVPGGLMICDDYGFRSCPGATAAFDEVLADKPEPIVNLPTGGAFIIKHPS